MPFTTIATSTINQKQIPCGGKRFNESENKSDTDTPLISVVTVVYNGAYQLAATIDSVLALKRSDIEYIVIDGGSTDGTVDLLHYYSAHLDYWRSEPDRGIYDAMNKGISVSRGTFIYHLNIGDQLLAVPPVLHDNNSSDIAIIAGRVRIGGNKIHIPSVGWRLNLHNTLHHQGCFYRRSNEIQYETKFRVFSDFDLNQRIIRQGRKVLLCDCVVASHDTGGASHSKEHFNEVFEIINKNHGPFWVALSFFYFKIRGLRNRTRYLWQHIFSR